MRAVFDMDPRLACSPGQPRVFRTQAIRGINAMNNSFVRIRGIVLLLAVLPLVAVTGCPSTTPTVQKDVKVEGERKLQSPELPLKDKKPN